MCYNRRIMKIKVILFTLLALIILTPISVSAHSGRTDSSGGHNCRVGACAGTYHYHNGGSAPVEPTSPSIQRIIPATSAPTRVQTRIPTRIPTITPTTVPTKEPTATIEPTKKVNKEVKTVQASTTPSGFFGWLISLFR